MAALAPLVRQVLTGRGVAAGDVDDLTQDCLLAAACGVVDRAA